MASASHPDMTDAGLDPTIDVDVMDEYRNIRTQAIAEERPLTIYVDSYEIVTLMSLGMYPELLALGYLKNQGLITDIREIKSIQLGMPPPSPHGRNATTGRTGWDRASLPPAAAREPYTAISWNNWKRSISSRCL